MITKFLICLNDGVPYHTMKVTNRDGNMREWVQRLEKTYDQVIVAVEEPVDFLTTSEKLCSESKICEGHKTAPTNFYDYD